MKMINYSQPDITEDDIDAVANVMRSGWLAGRGKIVDEFEAAISEYTGYKYAIAVNSATSGLYILSVLLKESGEEEFVRIPALTFVATMNAPLFAGFNVIINDVGRATLSSMDYKEYTPRILVSYGGFPVYGDVSTIIDDAHRLVRNMGVDSECFGSVVSTHAIKNITTGEGGIILTNRDCVYEWARNLCDHGVLGTHYGFNFRMSSIQAALGLSQLSRADYYHNLRREIADIYFQDLPIDIRTQPYTKKSGHHLYPIILPDRINRNEFREWLLKEGIRTQIHYEPLYRIALRHSEKNRIQIYDNLSDYPNSEEMWNHGLSLPIHNAMTVDDAEYVVEKIKQYYRMNDYVY